MTSLASLVPRQINQGSFVTAYAHAELRQRVGNSRIVLPVCPLGTPAESMANLGPWVLPPLYHEALTPELQTQLVDRIRQCFPYFVGTRARQAWRGTVDVVELPRTPPPARAASQIVAFSVDTAVEQHGPHLPLATDTIQSYAVLARLEDAVDGLVVAPPVDYGQLTWGLPFGFSIDITAPLLTRYVTGFVNAIIDWLAPDAIYVVGVHGSAIHHGAIRAGLAGSRCRRHAFRWLYDPLAAFAAGRGDVHAGGVETAVVRAISSELVDARWWPGRLDELVAGQMTANMANELSSDLSKFIPYVESRPLNGIVGQIRNFFDLDGPSLLERMVTVARNDVQSLLARGRDTAN